MTTKRDTVSALSPQQELALDLFATGKTVTQVAEALGVSRQTVSKWLNQDLEFRRALEDRRLELWENAKLSVFARLQKALDVLDEALENGSLQDKMRAAFRILDIAGLKPPSG